jgi:hypothetical protein
MPEIPALRRLRLEDHKFKASLSYPARSSLRNASKGWQNGSSGRAPA